MRERRLEEPRSPMSLVQRRPELQMMAKVPMWQTTLLQSGLLLRSYERLLWS